jgi:hypothetical protein
MEDLDISTHTARASGPLTPEQRIRKQERFLKAYRESGNIKASCKVAGINRQTFYNWRDHDTDFQAQLPDAKEDACDTLEFAAYEQAVKGIEVVTYEEIIDLDKDGKIKLDQLGEPVMRRSKRTVERKFSNSLLIRLLMANRPEKYKDKVEHVGKDDGPIKFVTEWGGGFLEEEEDEESGA